MSGHIPSTPTKYPARQKQKLVVKIREQPEKERGILTTVADFLWRNLKMGLSKSENPAYARIYSFTF
jgi:hypothetical protein